MITKRARLLTTAVAMAAGLIMTAGAANAATNPADRVGTVTTQPALSADLPGLPTLTVHTAGKLPAGTSMTTVTHQPTRVQVNATTYCYYGVYTRVNWNSGFILQWWFAMTTSFCYDNNTVTWHQTTISQDHGAGWNYSPGPTLFNCYATGGHPNCSGNHEHNESSYFSTKQYALIWVTIDQYEQYNGAWNWTWNTNAV